jgi:predicted ArsR family transcriptional regulator
MARAEDVRTITDVRTLAALAHPVRYALLDHLMATGSATASQCADALGQSPSNCSWHLRHLARFGLVEPRDSADGRERPWHATATGWRFDASRAGDAAAATTRALEGAELEQEDRLARTFLSAKPSFASEWRDAAAFSQYGLRVTAGELKDLTAAIDALVRPYIGLTREDIPNDAEPVHVSLRAFPRSRPAAGGAQPG